MCCHASSRTCRVAPHNSLLYSECEKAESGACVHVGVWACTPGVAQGFRKTCAAGISVRNLLVTGYCLAVAVQGCRCDCEGGQNQQGEAFCTPRMNSCYTCKQPRKQRCKGDTAGSSRGRCGLPPWR